MTHASEMRRDDRDSSARHRLRPHDSRERHLARANSLHAETVSIEAGAASLASEGGQSAERSLRRYRSALWIGIFLPFIYSNPRTSGDIAGGGLGALDILRGAGVVVAIIVALLYYRPTLRVSVIDLPLGLFAAVALASTAWSVDPRASILKLIPLVATFVAIRLVVSSYENSQRAVGALVGAVHAVLLATFVQFIVAPGLAFSQSSDEDIPRLGSFVPEVGANPLAFAASAGFVAVILGVGPKWTYRNIFVRSSLAVLYTAELLLTRTRSGLVVAAILVFFIGAGLVVKNAAPVIIAILLACALLIAGLTYSNAVQEFLARGQGDQSIETLTGRTEVWQVAWSSVTENPTLGLGFYSGHRLGLANLPNFENQSNLDSTWLELLVDVGALGTVPLALFMLGGSAAVIIVQRLSGRERTWLAFVLVYGLAISLVNPTLQLPGMNCTLIVASALICAGVVERHKDPQPAEATTRSVERSGAT